MGYKKNLITLLISFLISIGATEFLLGTLYDNYDKIPKIKNLGIDFDERNRFEVVSDRRKKGEKIYGMVPGYLKLSLNNSFIFPLRGGPKNSNTVYCNESGAYSTYLSDEFGFNNPQGLWKSKIIDVAFIGDSYTQGACVSTKENFVSRIKIQSPNSLNLGYSGTGPLIQLGIMKEFLNQKNIKHMIWSYYEGNDLAELDIEKKIPTLRNYLKENFSQNLVSKQEKVNEAIIDYLENFSNNPPKKAGSSIFDFLKHPTILVPNIRKFFNRFLYQYQSFDDWSLYKEILNQGKQFVEQRKGTLVFVYLPEFYRYDGIITSKAKLKSKVLNIVRSLNIHIIDMDLEFRKSQDPREFFPFKMRGHYNEKGYTIVAQAIRDYLNTSK